MKWQCALLQRWLPEYPEGDLPAFWKGRLKAHLDRCPACRAEHAALREVVEAIQTAPKVEPDPEFWTEYQRTAQHRRGQCLTSCDMPSRGGQLRQILQGRQSCLRRYGGVDGRGAVLEPPVPG